ncbi:hypothetical protein [Solidesulfovibrio magneticus]|uniref:Lipoprotein n=1 Tax=Solidesulfovibrio magneticus (strain ATCC 700980 / DSM 13731 / RS-1) TaxID=573370 RepID=C4XHB6_SOLM1|nr:hypothetical protein [Solidesulfovibrio magneticus]BAH73884.1 hypothetical protein DMR_03930 [Solidesulfovibrio magneticus RS-1]
MRHATLLLLAALVGALLAGCSVEPKMTAQHNVYIDNWTKRNNPEVYVEPQKAPPVPVSALIVPFQVTQDIPYGQDLGEQLTRVVWQTWTRDRVFPKLLYEANLKNASTPQAVALARKMGIDTVVVGKFTYIMSGGSRGDSGVSLTFDVIDAHSGERLWSMAHGGTMETGLTEDYILFLRKNRMPTEPLSAITATLAMDMGSPITNWNYGYKAPPPASPNPPPPAPPAGAGAGAGS